PPCERASVLRQAAQCPATQHQSRQQTFVLAHCLWIENSSGELGGHLFPSQTDQVSRCRRPISSERPPNGTRTSRPNRTQNRTHITARLGTLFACNFNERSEMRFPNRDSGRQ